MDADSSYTTHRSMDNLSASNARVSPRPPSDFEYATFSPFNANENCAVTTNEVRHLTKPESKLRENEVENCNCSRDPSHISSGCPKSSGYDFSKYATDVDTSLWPSRLSSRGSFTSSWSSADGDDVGWPSSSEGSCDEQVKPEMHVHSDNYYDDHSNGASVWCVDCKDDLMIIGCSDGTIEVFQSVK